MRELQLYVILVCAGNEKGSDRKQWVVTARDKGRFASTQDINDLSTNNSHINIPSNNKVGRGTRHLIRGKSSASDIASLKNSPIAYQPFNHSKSNAPLYPPPAKNSSNTLPQSTIKTTPPIVQENEKAFVKNINAGDQVEFDVPMTQQSSPQSELMRAPKKVSSADAIKNKEKPVSVASQFSQYAFKGGAPPLPRDYYNINSNGNRPFGLKRANSMRGEAASALNKVVEVPMSVDLNNVSHTRKYRFRFHSF